jgi:hypothetical protein
VSAYGFRSSGSGYIMDAAPGYEVKVYPNGEADIIYTFIPAGTTEPSSTVVRYSTAYHAFTAVATAAGEVTA